MDRATDIGLVRRFFALHAARLGDQAPAVYHQPASEYTSAEHLERELPALFLDRPLLAGLSADIPAPGDYFSFTSAGLPVVVVRGGDGAARAFVNTCRHRGSRLVEDRGTAKGGCLVCPYHAWTYSTDGRLTAQPGSGGGFDELDRDGLGLRPVALAEGHGLIFVRPGSDQPFDLDGVLGGLGPEIDSYKLGSYHHVETRTHVQNTNWKLVIDTFLEGYHIFALHKQSIAPYYLGQSTLFDPFGLHCRFVGPRRSILELEGRPESEWSILPHATTQYQMVPNALLVHQIDHFELWRAFPVSVDRTLVHTSLYAPAAPDERAMGYWRKNLDILLGVTNNEDFPQCEQIQANLAAGAADEIVFGRNEPALSHFHQSLATLLADA